MTTAAALVNEPVVRPASGNGKAAPKDAGGEDSFAKVLEAERDDAATQPAPAAAAAAKPAAPETFNESSAQPASASGEGAKHVLETALSNVESAATPPTKIAQVPPAAGATAQAVAPSPTLSTPAAQVTQTAQAADVAARLAASSGAAAGAGKSQAASTEDQSGASEETSPVGDGSTIAAVAGLDTQLVALPVATSPTAIETPTTPKAISQSAAPDGQPALAPAAVQDANAASKSAADTAAQADAQSTPAAKATPAAPASVQTSTQPPSASASADTVAKATVDTAAPTSSAATTPSASPLTASPQAPADASRAAVMPPALQSAPAATIQVYSRIIERADGRAQRFEVRLDPAELGRVDVRIEIGADRKVHAVLAAHDSAALSDLVRGQRALERALSGAGIDLADNGLRFELSSDSGRGNANPQHMNDGNGRSGQPKVWRSFEAATVPVSAETSTTISDAWRPQRLDLVA